MLRVALIRMICLALMFLAGLVLSNLGLPERFGTISLLALNASLLSIVTGLGVDSMVLYKVSNKQWSFSRTFHFIWRSIFVQISIFLLLELGSLLVFNRTLLSQQASGYFVVDAFYFLGLLIVEKYLTPEFRTGITAFYLMLPGYFFLSGVVYFRAFFSASGKFSYNLIASSCSFLLIVLADIILILLYSIEGTAVANALCYTAVFFVYLRILAKKFVLSWSGFSRLPKKNMVRCSKIYNG